MRPPTTPSFPRLPIGRRGEALFVAMLLGPTFGGCAREHRQITPTTLGTDLKRMPRGKMTPYPWPGQSIVKATPPSPRIGGPGPVDPDAAMASGERPPGYLGTSN